MKIEREKIVLFRTASNIMIAMTDDDLSGYVAASPEEFDWDLVLLDEAQDWPDNERDFIRAV